MKKIKLSLLMSVTFALFHNPAQAQGIPVYDAAGYAQFIQQLDQMTKEYEKQLQQLDQAFAQTNALTGKRNMGSLMNTPAEAALRRYLPDTWQETMHIIEANGLADGAFGTQSLNNSLRQTYQPLTGAEFMSQDPTGAIAQAYYRQTNTTYAAMSASEQAFNAGANRTETYDTLLSELDNTEDLKASIDLNARIAAENGMAINELTRLQAMQIQQRAAMDNQGLTGERRIRSFNKFDPVEAAKSFQPKE